MNQDEDFVLSHPAQTSDADNVDFSKRSEISVLGENSGTVVHCRRSDPSVVTPEAAAMSTLGCRDAREAARDLGTNGQKGINGLHPGQGGEATGSCFGIGCS